MLKKILIPLSVFFFLTCSVGKFTSEKEINNLNQKSQSDSDKNQTFKKEGAPQKIVLDTTKYKKDTITSIILNGSSKLEKKTQ